MSNTGKTKSYIIAVEDEFYARWQNEIARLKPRKRKNWKSFLKDKWGQRGKVIYKDDTFYTWSVIYSWWSEVWSETKIFSVMRDNANAKICPFSPFGRMYHDIMVSDLTDEDKSQLCRRLFGEAVKRNHTGNHAGRSNLNKGKSAVARTPNLQEKWVGK